MLNLIRCHYEAQNVLAYIAIVLAYIVYRKSIIDEYKSWIDIIISFKNELDYSKGWISDVYVKPHPDGRNPKKIVYPLTAVAAQSLIAKGHPPEGLLSEEFLNKTAIYNERIAAFNHVLQMQVFNYVVHENEKKAEYINYIIHNCLISGNDPWNLNKLYEYLKKNIEKVLKKKATDYLPWYLKRNYIILVLSLLTYLCIDWIL